MSHLFSTSKAKPVQPTIGLSRRRWLAVLWHTYERIVLATWRVDTSAVIRLRAFASSGKCAVLVLLHQQALAALGALRGLPATVVLGKHDEQPLVLDALSRAGIDWVKEESEAVGSLGQARHDIRPGSFVVFTADGSRGPAGACNAAAVDFASSAALPLFCLSLHVRAAVYLPTWDRTAFPLPFSRVSVELIGPLNVGGQADDAALEASRQYMESVLHRLHRDGFSATGGLPVPELSRLGERSVATSSV